MKKSFVILIVSAAIWGLSIGGIALGKTQTDETMNGAASTIQGFQGQAEQTGQFDQSQFDDLRRRIQSGEISQEELNQLRQQFGGQFRGQDGTGGRPGGQSGDGSGFGQFRSGPQEEQTPQEPSD